MDVVLVTAWLRRRQIPTAAGLVAALCVLNALLTPPSVAVGGGVVRTVLFTGMGVSLAVALLLQPAFGVLERALLKAQRERVCTVATWLLLTCAGASALSAFGGGRTAAIWTLTLSGIGCAAATWRADAAWWAPLFLGLSGILTDLVLPSDTLTRALAQTGLAPAACVALAGAGVFIVRGAEPGRKWA